MAVHGRRGEICVVAGFHRSGRAQQHVLVEPGHPRDGEGDGSFRQKLKATVSSRVSTRPTDDNILQRSDTGSGQGRGAKRGIVASSDIRDKHRVAVKV